ncbi:MAG TPA: hypothetical protein ENK95_01535, partial [Campylobacterales bacterium]|nr:hypothetical protein [Campylobacterales bacterium]
MIQTAFITVILILLVSFLSSPSKENGHSSKEHEEQIISKSEKNRVELMEVVEVKVEGVQEKVDVIIPGIPNPVALPKVANALDFKNTAKLLDVLEKEKASKEELLILNKRLKKELEQQRQNEEKLKIQLEEMKKTLQVSDDEARAYKESAKREIAELEKRLLQDVHTQKDLQTKIENFPTHINGLVDRIEEISTKAKE